MYHIDPPSGWRRWQLLVFLVSYPSGVLTIRCRTRIIAVNRAWAVVSLWSEATLDVSSTAPATALTGTATALAAALVLSESHFDIAFEAVILFDLRRAGRRWLREWGTRSRFRIRFGQHVRRGRPFPGVCDIAFVVVLAGLDVFILVLRDLLFGRHIFLGEHVLLFLHFYIAGRPVQGVFQRVVLVQSEVFSESALKPECAPQGRQRDFVGCVHLEGNFFEPFDESPERFVAPGMAKIEYCFKKASESCLKLSIELAGRFENHPSASPLNSSVNSWHLPASDWAGVRLHRWMAISNEEEVKKQLWLSAPLIGVSLLQYSLQVISVMFVGHLGSLPLSLLLLSPASPSSVSLSFLFVCEQLGTASALETLCGQAYGAKLYGKLGIQMQRAMFVLLILSVPLSIIWANTEQILVLVHQDKSIASVAGSYAKFMIPSLFAYGLLQCINRFLQAQNNVFPVFVCSGITTCLHVLLCWLFVLKTGLGYRGAALAISVSYWFNVILLSFYVKYSPSCSHSWTGFSKEAFKELYDFSKIAFPSAIMVCLELWSFELLVLASGLLPNPVLETSVLSICLNTSLTIWQISVGLGGAASIRVSNELGAGNPQVAKLAVYVIVGIAVAEGIVVVTVLLSIRKILGHAFSSDPKIISYGASMIPIVACGNFLDGLQCVLSGVARGCGWQKIGACVNLGSYYLVGVPLGLLLGFHFHIGGRGLWLGIVTALAVQVLCLSLVTIFTNWDKEKRRCFRVFEVVAPVVNSHHDSFSVHFQILQLGGLMVRLLLQ
ncbi:hypothetical protein CARUB_v10015718mg [Capsella rubella]|uniref:Protein DETOXIFICATION n=1 Tax=Capsella rubella TaxID=81985 RepID=R0I7K7_9BRAS|nr:hypothetical protein CARUB_v10015718mg [Capsella rubella]